MNDSVAVRFLDHKPTVNHDYDDPKGTGRCQAPECGLSLAAGHHYPPTVSLVEFNRGAPPAVVCRTCVYANNRTHRLSFTEINRLLIAREPLEAYGCTPDQDLGFLKVLADQSVIDGTEANTEKVVAFVDTCGWSPAAKCGRCARLVRKIVEVPYRLYEGGPLRYHPVTVGGHCSIPPEGITVSGRQGVVCDFIPKASTLEESCMNCEFAMTAGPEYMLDEPLDREVVKTDLDPYERYLTRRNALLANTNVGRAYQDARFALTRHPEGIYRWFSAELLGVRDRSGLETDGTLTVPRVDVAAFKVRFYGSGWTGWLPPTDDAETVVVHPIWATKRVGVEILLPRHERFGLAVPRQRRFRILPHPPGVQLTNQEVSELDDAPSRSVARPRPITGQPWTCQHAEGPSPKPDPNCSRCVGARMVLKDLEPVTPELIEPGCPSCHPQLGRACYFHSRRPYRDIASGEVWFRQPAATLPEPDASRRLIVVPPDEAGNVVIDGAGNEPEPVVFAARYSSLWAHAKDWETRRAILAQYHRMLGRLPASRPVDYELGYGAPLYLEPFKAYCALALERTRFRIETGSLTIDAEGKRHRVGAEAVNVRERIAANTYGIDFRDAMGDSFGRLSGENFEERSRTMRRNSAGTLEYLNPYPTWQGESWTDRMATEEYIRGYNPLERLTEEELVNEAVLAAGKLRFTMVAHAVASGVSLDEAVPADHRGWRRIFELLARRGPAPEPRLVRLDMGIDTNDDGSLTHHLGGGPVEAWAYYTPEADRAAFMEYLDEFEEVTIAHAGMEVSGEVRRNDVTAFVTHRWSEYGYDIRGKHSTDRRGRLDDAALFSFDHVRHLDTETAGDVFACPNCRARFDDDALPANGRCSVCGEILAPEDRQGFVCPTCDQHWSPDERPDDGHCPDDDTLLFWAGDAGEWRRSVSFTALRDLPMTEPGRRGIGSAVAADRPSYQNQTRLSRMCCDRWQRKGSNPLRPVTLRGRTSS